MAWTTTQLLAHIRRVASLPTASTMVGYTDADLLAHADAVLQGRIAPMVARARDEHAIHSVDVAVAAGEEFVRLPPRVAAGRLRDVTQPWPAGGSSYVNVPRLEPEDVAEWIRPQGLTSQSVAIVVQAGFLQLVPAPQPAMTLRISYLRTPPQLALVSACTLVTGLTVEAVQLTAAHAGTLAAGNWDFVLLSNGDSLGDQVATIVAGVGSTTFLNSELSPTFSASQAEANRYVVEGVYLCPAGTTCVVPLPDMVSTLLAYRAACAVLTSIGDTQGVDRLEAQADMMERELVPLISERIEGEPQRVRPSMHRRRAGWW